MNDRKRKKRDKEKAKNTPKYEVKVDLEHYKIYDIENSTILGAEKNRFDPFIFAKKNPEFAALIFTISTAGCNFFIKLVLYMYFLGYYKHFNIDSSSMSYENPSSIVSLAISIVGCIFFYCVVSLIIDIWKRNKVKALGIIFLVTFSALFVLLVWLTPSNLKSNFILSSVATVILVFVGGGVWLVLKFFRFIFNMLFLFINWCKSKKISKNKENVNIKENSTLQNNKSDFKLIICLVCIYILAIIFSIYLIGKDVADSKLKFKVIDNNSVILCEYNGKYICSPCKIDEKNQILYIEKGTQKQINSEDVEYKIYNFQEVK